MTTVQHQKDVIKLMRELLGDNYTHLHVTRVLIEEDLEETATSVTCEVTDEATGELTARGKRIIDHTPMARFGMPEDLLGTVLWLLSPASAFVTGAVIPIDGGFAAYAGV